jgi:hypothetical protein
MWKRAQRTVVAFVVIGGLFSGLACQAHMVLEAGSAPGAPSHNASHEDTHAHGAGAPSHHGTHHEGSSPEEPCCIVQVADSKTLNPTVLLPDAIPTTVVAIVEEPAQRLPDPIRAITHGPPGNCSLLLQTCVLLI